MFRFLGLSLVAFSLLAASPPPKLKLTDSPTAVAMTAPVLPARIVGDCPSPDPCEFGTKWRVCEAVPAYREPRDGAPLLRMMKADEIFIATGAEIELIAPGEVEVLAPITSEGTGGLALTRGMKIAAYGPMPNQRALYFDPASGKGWSPEPASDHFWWEEKKVARLTKVPAMTWWVKAKLGDGKSGWLQLKAVPDLQDFPMYDAAPLILTWDIDKVRDDETPDCAGMFRIREVMAGRKQ